MLGPLTKIVTVMVNQILNLLKSHITNLENEI